MSELQNQKMEKLIDEILLSKKQDSESIVKKQSETSDSPIEQILLRNLESVKRLADKEGLDINKLVKHLKSSE